MRLGFATEDVDKKPVRRKALKMNLGFSTKAPPPPPRSVKQRRKKTITKTRRLGVVTTVSPTPRRRPLDRQRLTAPPNCVAPSTRSVPGNMVSIIILTYNTRQVTLNCIKSVLKKTVHPFELIVVDNASRDDTVRWLRRESYLTLIRNKKNIGFSKGNNIAIRRARGRYILLMNSDIIVRTRGWLGSMVKLADSRSDVGTVGAKLLYPNGTIQHVGGGIYGRNPYHPYEKCPATMSGFNKPREVPYNTGACLLITRKALSKVGLLDEGYPFGFEDVDYGLQVVEAGLRNLTCPAAELTHLWAYTQRKTRRGLTTTSLNRYHRKWDQKLPQLAKKVKLFWGHPFAKT